MKTSIDIKKQEMAAIEGKSVKVKAEMENNKSYILNNQKKIEDVRQEIEKITKSIEENTVEMKGLDERFIKNKEESASVEKELAKIRDQYG